jgi:hypothetical protein
MGKRFLRRYEVIWFIILSELGVETPDYITRVT